MKKRSNSNQRTLTVDKIMLKIKEVSKQKKKSLASEELFENTTKNFYFADLQQRETNFYIFAKKTGRKLNKLGPYGFFKKVKKLIPQRLKYKKLFGRY